jgi:hypothetical protein
MTKAIILANQLRDGMPYDEARIENELRRLAQVEVHRNQLLQLLAELRGWDHLNSVADGEYWKRRIDQLKLT